MCPLNCASSKWKQCGVEGLRYFKIYINNVIYQIGGTQSDCILYAFIAYSTGQLQAFTYCTMLNVHLVGSIRLRYTMVILIVLELKQIQSNASFLDIW